MTEPWHTPAYESEPFCDGPLILYDSTAGMILRCASCGYIITSGNRKGYIVTPGNRDDEAHMHTLIVCEGLGPLLERMVAAMAKRWRERDAALAERDALRARRWWQRG